MSQASSNPSPFGEQTQPQAVRHRKPRADLYTMLLLIAWIAILLGILCLYLEMKQYEFKFDGAPAAQLASPVAARAVGFAHYAKGPQKNNWPIWTGCGRQAASTYRQVVDRRFELLQREDDERTRRMLTAIARTPECEGSSHAEAQKT